MALLTTTMQGPVAVLTLNGGDNRFNGPLLAEVRAELARLADDGTAGAVVVTGGNEKFFCNGLHLDWMKEQDASGLVRFLTDVSGLLRETVLYPKPLIAAVNGHAFGLGAIWASGMDFRFVREDRGWICFPEFDINIPLTPGMLAVCELGLGREVVREMVWSAKRYSGTEAVSVGWARAAYGQTDLVPKAVELATFMAAKKQPAFAVTKRQMALDTARLIEERDPAVVKMFSLR